MYYQHGKTTLFCGDIYIILPMNIAQNVMVNGNKAYLLLGYIFPRPRKVKCTMYILTHKLTNIKVV